jgi:hypothetical protein
MLINISNLSTSDYKPLGHIIGPDAKPLSLNQFFKISVLSERSAASAYHLSIHFSAES